MKTFAITVILSAVLLLQSQQAALETPSVETWVLRVMVSPHIRFNAGEYQTEDRCQQGARIQMRYWRIIYGDQIIWRCRVERP